MKAVSATVSSDFATGAFGALDQDNDGRLTAQELTNDFCPEALMSIQSLAVASPFLNEIRAKDQEIAFLKAKIEALGGDASEFVSPETTQVEFSRAEINELIKPNKARGWEYKTRENPELRAALAKVSNLIFKVYNKVLFKLA